MWTFIFLALTGYLIGSIPSSYLSMRLFTGKDIRTMGTGQATVTAVLLYGGKLPALVALLSEILKAVVCLIIAYLLVGELWASFVILIGAVYGCSWNIWLKGRGGQGVTIAVSGLVLINILVVLLAAPFYILTLVIARRHVLGSYLFKLGIPLVLGLWYRSWEFALAGFLLMSPAIIKQLVLGDDIVKARKTNGVS